MSNKDDFYKKHLQKMKHLSVKDCFNSDCEDSSN